MKKLILQQFIALASTLALAVNSFAAYGDQTIVDNAVAFTITQTNNSNYPYRSFTQIAGTQNYLYKVSATIAAGGSAGGYPQWIMVKTGTGISANSTGTLPNGYETILSLDGATPSSYPYDYTRYFVVSSTQDFIPTLFQHGTIATCTGTVTVTVINADVSQLTTEISNLNTQITTLQTQATTDAASIAALQNQLAALQAQYDSLLAAYNALQGGGGSSSSVSQSDYDSVKAELEKTKKKLKDAKDFLKNPMLLGLGGAAAIGIGTATVETTILLNQKPPANQNRGPGRVWYSPRSGYNE